MALIITYPDKSAAVASGYPDNQTIRDVDLNEIKTVVNSHATDIDAVEADIATLQSDVTTLQAFPHFDNLVVVNQSNAVAILGGVIDSTKQYFIDGTVDLGTTSIDVPTTGISISGYGYGGQSLLTSSENSYTMFSTATSGTVIFSNITIKVNGTSSSVFSLIANAGTEAVEMVNVNFEDCTSLGILDGFRQGLETNTARFGGTPELEFRNAMNGYRITTAIVRNLSNITALFKAGTGLIFSGRFITDINCDLPATGALFDFAPSNFTNNESLVVRNAFVSRAGVFDSTDTAIYPNINDSDTESIWSGNTGLPNTVKYINASISSASATTINTIGTYEVLAGTFTANIESHFDMPANGEFEALSGQERYMIAGDIPISGTSGEDIELRITKSTDGGATYPTEVASIARDINNLVGGVDTAFFVVNYIVTMNAGDRVRIEVRNNTSTNNVTASAGSYFLLSSI